VFGRGDEVDVFVVGPDGGIETTFTRPSADRRVRTEWAGPLHATVEVHRAG
jgi:hypothetical protein